MKAENADLPASCPPHDPWIGGIVLDLPPPISVNRTHKIDWKGRKRLVAWQKDADTYVLGQKCRSENPLKLSKVKRFELWIILSEGMVDIDADNTLKNLIDYLRRIELIENDAKKNMRGVHVVFGIAPVGCRVIVRPHP